ncbi:hypothetical protein [Thauera humireducens]|uniref:hypothetical protein n=1 Tax=Thauera humireducens TaxID=1134435 RepID=UPI00311F759C
MLSFCEAQDCALNVELKPTPGTEFETGVVVARTLQRDWRGRLPPLLSSFRHRSPARCTRRRASVAARAADRAARARLR